MLWLLACAPEPIDLRVADATRHVDIRDGVIVAVGPGSDGATLTADLLTAGFVDAHAHPAGLGKSLDTLDLVGSPSYADTLARVRAATAPGWLVGRGWDQNDWTDAPAGGWPLAADLPDDRPIVLTRVDGHALWLNRAALAAAKIDASTPDPPGGQIVRGPGGAPTGVLVDNAADLVHVPSPSDADLARRLDLALAAVAAAGLTGVHDMGVDDATLRRYEALDAEGKLPVRVFAYLDPTSEAASRLLATGPWSGRHLSVVGIKAYADGALGSRGALLRSEYADQPGHLGLAVTDAAALADLATRCLGARAQLAVHAIGDQGVSNALDAFAAARKAHPDRGDVRLRVEHAQVVHPDDVRRFLELGAVASMQPTHATSDMPWAEARLGPERVRWAYAWRTMLRAGVPLAFGSDFPVEAVDPGLGLRSAITRADANGEPKGGWMPDQKLTADEAIAAFTSGAAYAVHAEDRLGTLEVGRPADLTLWSTRDGYRAVATIVDGAVVWRDASGGAGARRADP